MSTTVEGAAVVRRLDKYLNVKEEPLSPKENITAEPEEVENGSDNETNCQSTTNILCIKEEILDEDENEDPLNEELTLHDDYITIKEEVTNEVTNTTCFEQKYEEIRNDNLLENATAKIKLQDTNSISFKQDYEDNSDENSLENATAKISFQDTNSVCFRQHCEEIRKENLIENNKKSYKDSLFNFSSDCTEVLPRKKTKRKNESEVDVLMKSAMEGLQILQNHLTKPNEDHIDAFVNYIASELREIKNPLNLMEAKQSIFNIIYDIRKRELK